MTDSRTKGKRGELDAARMVARATGCRAWRGRQHRGGADSPDVRTEPDGIHLEVKRTEHLRLYDAVDQAEHEADGQDAVAVVHRRNGRGWVWIVPAERIEAFRQWLNDCAIHRAARREDRAQTRQDQLIVSHTEDDGHGEGQTDDGQKRPDQRRGDGL